MPKNAVPSNLLYIVYTTQVTQKNNETFLIYNLGWFQNCQLKTSPQLLDSGLNWCIHY
jgi:hypothetical protein